MLLAIWNFIKYLLFGRAAEADQEIGKVAQQRDAALVAVKEDKVANEVAQSVDAESDAQLDADLRSVQHNTAGPRFPERSSDK